MNSTGRYATTRLGQLVLLLKMIEAVNHLDGG